MNRVILTGNHKQGHITEHQSSIGPWLADVRPVFDPEQDRFSRRADVCARRDKTVSELDLLKPLELLFERKQIPQFVVNIRSRRKAMEPLEATRLPWAQGVVSSNLAAPTKSFILSIILASNKRRGRHRAPASGAVD